MDDQFAADFLVQSASFQSFPTGIGDDMAKVDGVALLSRDQYTPALIGGEPEVVGTAETPAAVARVRGTSPAVAVLSPSTRRRSQACPALTWGPMSMGRPRARAISADSNGRTWIA